MTLKPKVSAALEAILGARSARLRPVLGPHKGAGISAHARAVFQAAARFIAPTRRRHIFSRRAKIGSNPPLYPDISRMVPRCPGSN
jgi:hypothetical protein